MPDDRLKKYETIGCCGIDCGLCPRFFTKGPSACPGCGGQDFYKKHPSCGVLTCCVKKNGFETCAECGDFPCKRFDSEKDGYDSFVTHKKISVNLGAIADNGIAHFAGSQQVRIDILNDLLENYDDGRSKSFFCLCCALLPVDKLEEVRSFALTIDGGVAPKEKCRLVREYITGIAESAGISLKLNKKG